MSVRRPGKRTGPGRSGGIPLLLLLLALPSAAADPPLRASTLLENDRFWPYRVASRADGSVGVLIRVEPGGIARVDFGRDGLRRVLVAETDLLERAEQVRAGELEKQAPNFVLAVGPRLVDSTADALRAYPFEGLSGERAFLCVFADPAAPGFAAIADELAPLADLDGTKTILFPQGARSDAALRDDLRRLRWSVPFVYGHLSEAYTRTLLPESLAPPAVLLVTSEGRVLAQSAFRAGLAPELAAALPTH